MMYRKRRHSSLFILYITIIFINQIFVIQAFCVLIIDGERTEARNAITRITSTKFKPHSTTSLFDLPNSITNSFDEQRRKVIEWAVSSSLALVGPDTLDTDQSIEVEESITIPLEWQPSLNAYVLYFYLFASQPEKFGAILDTGSPFLTVPSYCNRKKWGCYRPELTNDSGYSNTFERFDNNEGTVVWRKSRFSFNGALGSMMGPEELVFGVLDEQLMAGPGGVFFGLIKETEKRIRPSFLGQLNVMAFAIDLQSREKASLTLRTKSNMIQDKNYIPLVTDLNRRYKDPVIHYTAIANSLVVNGQPLLQSKGKFRNQPTYAIFDTGVSGMVLSQELFLERYRIARQNKAKSLWGSVDIQFQTKDGNLVTLHASEPVTTPLGEKPWIGFNANLIVIGLAFLEGHTMLVDIDDLKLKID